MNWGCIKNYQDGIDNFDDKFENIWYILKKIEFVNICELNFVFRIPFPLPIGTSKYCMWKEN